MTPRVKALKKKLRTGEPRMITNGQQLHRSVLAFNWRQGPVQFGLPAQSQVLAEFIRAAGYEGVLYKSTKGPGSCVAVFPDKLLDGSFIELAGAAPQEVKHLRLDGVSAIDLCGYDGLPSQAKRLVQGG